MMTIRKLSTLPPKTLMRKSVVLLDRAERELVAGGEIDRSYFGSLLNLLFGIDSLERAEGTELRLLRAELGEPGDAAAAGGPAGAESMRRIMNRTRHLLLRFLGAEPADWDFLEIGGETLDAARRRILPITLYLDDIRSPFNVGSIFRTAESFGVQRILLSPGCPPPTHPRAARVARGCEQVIPWEILPVEAIAERGGVFALELGGEPLDSFRFPLPGTAVLGSEELGVSPEGRKIADAAAGRVSIPLHGAKGSLNVSVAAGILLHAWFGAASGVTD